MSHWLSNIIGFGRGMLSAVLPMPGRSARAHFLVFLFIVAFGWRLEFQLANVATVTGADRDKARSNWERVQKAFESGDSRALKDLIGCQVLILVDSTGSPWTGKAYSIDVREAAQRDAATLTEASSRNEEDRILKEMQKDRETAWNVRCKIAFTRKQVRHHFIWPDAVFSTDFELLGTLTAASNSGQRVRIKPIAIQRPIVQL